MRIINMYLKKIISLLQVGFTDNFVPGSPFKLNFRQFKFDIAFLPYYTKF